MSLPEHKRATFLLILLGCQLSRPLSGLKLAEKPDLAREARRDYTEYIIFCLLNKTLMFFYVSNGTPYGALYRVLCELKIVIDRYKGKPANPSLTPA